MNRDTTFKDPVTSSSLRVCWEMNSANSLELRACELDRPSPGASKFARNLGTLYVSEDTKTIGWKGNILLLYLWEAVQLWRTSG